MYPFAIINSFGSKIERVYRQFAAKVNKVLIPALSELLPSPQSHDVVRQIRVSPSPKGRGASSIRLDASNILELLEEIRLNYGDYVDQEKLEKIISENINLLDGWSTSQLNRMIENISKDGSRPVPTGVDKPVVPLIPKKNVVSMQNIPLANNSQRLLQNDAYSKYFFDVEEIINNGIIDGLNADEITKQILDKVDMNAKRARFWAEDQASIFQAEQTRLKAIREGQTHYKWIAGASARPSHAVHNGQVYSWNVGVNNLSRPGARHPGEDYRCHCKIGLATADEIAKAGSPPPRAPQSTAGLIENYSGSEAVKAEKGKAFIESMNSTVANVAQNIVQAQVAKVIKPTPEFDTTAKAQAWARENNIADVVNYKGLDAATANAMNQSVHEAIQEFPELRENFKFIGSAQERIKLKNDTMIKKYFDKLKETNPNVSDDRLLRFATNKVKESRINDNFKYLKAKDPSLSERKLLDAARIMYREQMTVSGSTYAESVGSGQYSGVTTNRSWSFNRATNAAKRNVISKYHPQGTDSVKSLIDHEIGHQLDDLLDITNDSDIITLRSELINTAVNVSDEIKYQRITDGLSEYSWKNTNEKGIFRELTAEAYAEYKNNPQAREVAKKIGQRIQEKYNAKLRR